mmetsp:Transcript_5967/g.17839  ORF Transcript_5967/g.17839 Transcript_5967/m.17839 type:complete len:229 (+) Transcript_5967:697-1383(+)
MSPTERTAPMESSMKGNCSFCAKLSVCGKAAAGSKPVPAATACVVLSKSSTDAGLFGESMKAWKTSASIGAFVSHSVKTDTPPSPPAGSSRWLCSCAGCGEVRRPALRTRSQSASAAPSASGTCRTRKYEPVVSAASGGGGASPSCSSAALRATAWRLRSLRASTRRRMACRAKEGCRASTSEDEVGHADGGVVAGGSSGQSVVMGRGVPVSACLRSNSSRVSGSAVS